MTAVLSGSRTGEVVPAAISPLGLRRVASCDAASGYRTKYTLPAWALRRRGLHGGVPAATLELARSNLYDDRLLMRGGAVWQLVGLITRRSQVRILPPLPVSE